MCFLVEIEMFERLMLVNRLQLFDYAIVHSYMYNKKLYANQSYAIYNIQRKYDKNNLLGDIYDCNITDNEQGDTKANHKMYK